MGSSVTCEGLLAGIRVLDLTDQRAAFCSRLLADLGAFVIKVEKPGGDSSRRHGPFLDVANHFARSLSFLYNNINKRSMTLDIEHREGRSLFVKLAERTDVIVETFPPGYLPGIDLSYDTLRGVNDGLILASVTGFGQSGPKSRFKSCDLVSAAFGGQMYVSGSPAGPPLATFGEQSHYSASLFAAAAILLALRNRRRTGTGTHLDISVQECVAATLEHVLIRGLRQKVVPARQGALHWDSAFFIVACMDGFILMTLFQQWRTLVEWLDSEGMAADLTDERWEDEAFRGDHVDHVIEVLARWTRTHTVEELFELGQAMRFPWAPVQSPKAVLESPQLKDRRFFVSIEHAATGSLVICPRMPYKFSHCFSMPRQCAPEIGADNEGIYQELLGLSGEELERLHQLGVI